MDREFLLSFESGSLRRPCASFELRAATSGNTDVLVFEGHASTTEDEYDVYGGVWPGWKETMAAGAFKRTINSGADVAFLINHEGMTLARTKSGTMTLDEDDVGLHVVAELDSRQQPVADLAVASERGDVDEMSFAFRVTKDEWSDDDGNPATSWDGTRRRIVEVNLNKGDVSAVNYGANPATSGGFRELDRALAELRSGKTLTPAQRAAVRDFAATLEDRATQMTPEDMGPHAFEDGNQDGICDVCGMTEAQHSQMDADQGVLEVLALRSVLHDRWHERVRA